MFGREIQFRKGPLVKRILGKVGRIDKKVISEDDWES